MATSVHRIVPSAGHRPDFAGRIWRQKSLRRGWVVKRHGTRPISPIYWFAVATLWPTLMTVTKRDWRGTEILRRNYPPEDGVVVAANHPPGSIPWPWSTCSGTTAGFRG